jgi:CRISPR-associated endonuclease Csy4
MKHYIDITLLPSDDIGIHFLWSKVMMQVHLALVEIQNENQQVSIAVSFPEYRTAHASKPGYVGKTLRIFAPQMQDLEQLDINRWLKRLCDYVHIKAAKNVPVDISEFENFSRRQKAGSPDRLIRRRMKRKGVSIEEATQHFLSYRMKDQDKRLPFIKLKSLASDNDFNLVVQRNLVDNQSAALGYSTYGLSSEGGLPKF